MNFSKYSDFNTMVLFSTKIPFSGNTVFIILFFTQRLLNFLSKLERIKKDGYNDIFAENLWFFFNIKSNI